MITMHAMNKPIEFLLALGVEHTNIPMNPTTAPTGIQKSTKRMGQNEDINPSKPDCGSRATEGGRLTGGGPFGTMDCTDLAGGGGASGTARLHIPGTASICSSLHPACCKHPLVQ